MEIIMLIIVAVLVFIGVYFNKHKNMDESNTTNFSQEEIADVDNTKTVIVKEDEFRKDMRRMIVVCAIIWFTSIVLPSKIEVVVNHDFRTKYTSNPIVIELRNR